MRLIGKLVCKNLKLNKKRTVVTIIGIILSISLLSAVASMAISFQKSIVSYQKQKDGDYHVVFSGVKSNELGEFDENRSIDHYFTISNLGYARLDESKNEYKPYCRIVATDDEGLKQAGFKLVEGRMPQNENEIVIPRHLKTNGRIDFKVGDTLKLDLGDRVNKEDGHRIEQEEGYTDKEEIINIKTKKYKIVGVIERPIFGVEAYSCPAYTFVTYANEKNDDLSIYVSFTKKGLKRAEDITVSIVGMDSALTQKAIEENAKYNFFMNSNLISYERLWPVDPMFLVIYGIAIIVVFIIILTSVYCIKNSFEISISEKIRQYGMLSSIGATKKQIRKSVHVEAAVMGIIGLPIGIICGMLAAMILVGVCNILLGSLLAIEFVFYPSLLAIILSVLLGIITIYLSAASSARKASRVSPMEAIRNQKEITLNAKKIKTPKYIGKIWGIGGVISYKNIKRNKKKYRTTVVSIVICTVTFIVVSYFMSMAMELVHMSYSQDDYNISMSLDLSQTKKSYIDQIKELDYIKWCSIGKSQYMSVENPSLSDDYKNYLKAQNMEAGSEIVKIIALDDEAFKEYAPKCGMSDGNNKVILVNKCVFNWESNGKAKSGEINVFKYNKDDKFKFVYIDDSEVEFDENDEVIESSLKKNEYECELSKITDERPTGYNSEQGTNMLVMNEKTAKLLNITKLTDCGVYFQSDEPDKLQDELDDYMTTNIGDDNVHYYIDNRDKDEKDERTLFVLIEVFAYGFIIVIALIGITNIVNTLNTSMELRSREFATLRSIGMTDLQFKRMVRLESFFTSIKSLIIGVTIGTMISYVINVIECRYDTVILFKLPVMSIIMCVVVVMALIYIIISRSMKRINRKNIIETIKNENL